MRFYLLVPFFLLESKIIFLRLTISKINKFTPHLTDYLSKTNQFTLLEYDGMKIAVVYPCFHPTN